MLDRNACGPEAVTGLAQAPGCQGRCVWDALSREPTRTPVQLKAHTWRGQRALAVFLGSREKPLGFLARSTGFLS
jgi:hypothetical protein